MPSSAVYRDRPIRRIGLSILLAAVVHVVVVLVLWAVADAWDLLPTAATTPARSAAAGRPAGAGGSADDVAVRVDLFAGTSDGQTAGEDLHAAAWADAAFVSPPWSSQRAWFNAFDRPPAVPAFRPRGD